MKLVAEAFAEKLGESKGRTVVMFPKQGWSAVDRPSCHMYDPRQDQIFLDILKERVGEKVDLREIDANLEDELFAEAVEEACLDIFPKAVKTRGLFAQSLGA